MANPTNDVVRLNEEELRYGVRDEASWHTAYRDTSWVFVGGLAPELSEGDLLCVFSQFGEIEDLNLIRDEVTGESRGFAFIKYEDWYAAVLTIDNFAGVELVGKRLRLDHSRYIPRGTKKSRVGGAGKGGDANKSNGGSLEARLEAAQPRLAKRMMERE